MYVCIYIYMLVKYIALVMGEEGLQPHRRAAQEIHSRTMVPHAKTDPKPSGAAFFNHVQR